MVTLKSVGVSRYKGWTNGREQFMSEHAATRALDLIELVAREPGCRRLTINEGVRSRPRQDALWAAWRAGTGVLAARPYTSRHDEVTNGNAADFGGPNGEALLSAEIMALKRLAPRVGGSFTGLTFTPVEPWHLEFEESPYTSIFASKNSQEEESLMLRMYHENKTGKVYGVNLSTGAVVHIPSEGHLALMVARKMVVNEPAIRLPENEFGYLMDYVLPAVRKTT